MHYRMLVTISSSGIATSEDARQTVYDDLSNDDSFCGSGGRFGSPECDWFVIGGRWSGLLAETQMGEAYRHATINRFPEMASGWFPHNLAEEHREELDALWQSCGGLGQSPYTRSDHDLLGYPDDAMPVTRELYAALLTPYAGHDRVYEDGFCNYIDFDGEQLAPDAIGTKWLVVVDYHN